MPNSHENVKTYGFSVEEQKEKGLIARLNKSIHPRHWSKNTQYKKNEKNKRDTEVETD